MKIQGGCHCGAITYKADVDPDRTAICHCTDCQKLTGTAFRVTVQVPEADIAFSGTPKIYVKVGDSGNKRAQGFCGECGSHLFATSVGDGPKVYGLRAGTSDQRQQLVPVKQVWHRSALHWLPEFDGMETAEKA